MFNQPNEGNRYYPPLSREEKERQAALLKEHQARGSSGPLTLFRDPKTGAMVPREKLGVDSIDEWRAQLP